MKPCDAPHVFMFQGAAGNMLLMAAKYTGRLGPFVRERRKELGLTGDDLARLIGCSRGAITSIEIGKTRLPSPEIVEGLAREFGVSQARILYQAGYLTEYEAAVLSQPENLRKAQAILEELRATLAEAVVDIPDPPTNVRLLRSGPLPT